MASSKLFDEVALISLTFATDILRLLSPAHDPAALSETGRNFDSTPSGTGDLLQLLCRSAIVRIAIIMAAEPSAFTSVGCAASRPPPATTSGADVDVRGAGTGIPGLTRSGSAPRM